MGKPFYGDFDVIGGQISVDGEPLASLNDTQYQAAFIPGRPQGTLQNNYTFNSGVEGWTATGGSLSASNGKLISASTGDMLATAPGSAIANGELYIDLEHAFNASNNDIGVVCRRTDDNNLYLISIRGPGNGNPTYEIFKKVSGAYTSLIAANQPTRYQVGHSFKVLVRFVGSKIEVFVNDDLVIACKDSTHTTGGFGLRCGASDREFECDNFATYTLPANWTPSWNGGQLASASPGSVTRYNNQGGSDSSPTVSPGQTITMATRTLTLEEPKLVYVTGTCDIRFPNSNSKAGHIWIELDDNGTTNGQARWHTHGQESGSDNLTSTAIFYVPSGSHDIKFKINSDGGSSNDAIASRYIMDTFVIDPYDLDVGRNLTGSGALVSATKTNGDVSVTATSATAFDSNFDLYISAEAGDKIELSISARCDDTNAVGQRFDVATVASGSVVNYVSSGTATPSSVGVSGWYVRSGGAVSISGSVTYTVQQSDIVAGQVRFRIMAWLAGAGSRLIKADTGSPFKWFVQNISRVTIDGIDNESGPIQLWQPDAPPLSPSPEDSEFISTQELGSKWTTFSWGSWSASHYFSPSKGLTLQAGDHDNTNKGYGVYRNVLSGNWTLTTKTTFASRRESFKAMSVGLYANAPGNSGSVRLHNATNASDKYSSVDYFTNNTTYNSSLGTLETGADSDTMPRYLRIVKSGTTYTFAQSEDGLHFQVLYSGTIAITPTHIGLVLTSNTNTNTQFYGSFEYVRFEYATDYSLPVGRKIAVNSGSSPVTSYSILPSWKGFDIDAPKAGADSVDDDFDSSTLAGKWTVVEGSAGTVNPLSSSANGYDLNTSPGKILVQATSSNKFSIRQDFTLPDGKSIIAKITPNLSQDSSQTLANNEMWCGIAINDNDTNYQLGNTNAVFFDVDVDAMAFMSYDHVSTTTFGKTPNQTLDISSPTYFRIYRSGLTYHFAVSKDGQTWLQLGSNTESSALNNIWIYVSPNVAGGTPTPIVAIDWVRLGSNSVIPWTMQPDAGVTIEGTSIRDRLWLPDQDNPLGLDDEFDDDTISPSWVVVQPESTRLSIVEGAGSLSFKHVNGDGSQVWRGFVKPSSLTAPFYIETAMSLASQSDAYKEAGLVMSNGITHGGSSKQVTHALSMAGTTRYMQTREWNNWNSYVDENAQITFTQFGPFIYLRLAYESANTFSGWWSIDGLQWVKYSSNQTATLVPTYIGLASTTYNSSTPSMINFSYFRVRQGLPS